MVSNRLPAPLRPVTDGEAAAFARDGAVLLRGVLPAEWVAAAADGLDRAIGEPDGMSVELGSLRVDQFPAARASELGRLVTESALAAIVGQTIGAPVRFYMDQLFHKPAGWVSPTPWHQDTCYYNVEGHGLVRAWVSPDVVPRDLSLEVVRGSHLWNVTYAPLAGRDAAADAEAREQFDGATDDAPVLGADAHENWDYFSGVRDDRLPPVPDIEANRGSFEILGWDYEPGDVIVFHGNILHSARGGREHDLPRRAHASMWAGPDVRYLHRPGQIIPDPIALYEHSPRSGQPLSDFPDVFPVRWAPAGSASG